MRARAEAEWAARVGDGGVTQGTGAAHFFFLGGGCLGFWFGKFTQGSLEALMSADFGL